MFVSHVRDTCDIGIIVLSYDPTFFNMQSMHIETEISLFTCSGNKLNIILRNNFTQRTLSLVSASSDWCVNASFGSWGNKLYLFHMFGIHVLSELSFPLFPLISSRMKYLSEISFSLVRGTSLKLLFEIRPYLKFFYSQGF